jgi:septum formation protein
MHQQNKLILASASPRRQQLLHELGISFEVHPANIVEERNSGEHPLAYATRLAQEKAMKVARQFPQHIVLGADTIVVVDSEVLGKPEDADDAARMLRMLSARTHQVITAVSLVTGGKDADTRTCASDVCFKQLDEREIQEYIAGGEPMDKAGAYAIQGEAARWILQLTGDYSNVVGLPLPVVTEMLRASGFLQT